MNTTGTLGDFSTVMASLKRGLGAWAAQGLISHVLALAVYGRLGRAGAAIARLMALFEAGKLRPWAPRVSVAVPQLRVVRVSGPREMPVQFAWLVRMAAWHAAGLGGQLQHVLEQPAMVALLQASPQARRVLGPVCRMLAVSTRVLRPGPDGNLEKATGVAAVVVRKVRTPRPPIDWGRVPLPRGVLTAARRAGFKPVR